MVSDWEDQEDEWSEQIKAAFPTRSGSHDEYGMAMKMVGNRHSKSSLVALVNWLLVRCKKADEQLKMWEEAHENSPAEGEVSLVKGD